jgi:hypothetical protein
MKNEIEAMITDITTTTAEAEDYTGEDGLLYCGKCHTPKEAYFSKETAQWLGHDRHPTDCDCQRAAREKQQAAESRQKHLETVEDLKTGSLKVRTRITVVRVPAQIGKAVLLCIGFKNTLLIGNGIAFALQLVLMGKSWVKGGNWLLVGLS